MDGFHNIMFPLFQSVSLRHAAHLDVFLQPVFFFLQDAEKDKTPKNPMICLGVQPFYPFGD